MVEESLRSRWADFIISAELRYGSPPGEADSLDTNRQDKLVIMKKHPEMGIQNKDRKIKGH